MSFKDPDDFRTRLARLALEGVDTVAGPRNATYGPPDDDMAAVAMMWTAYLRQRGLIDEYARVEAHDVAAAMMMVKLCRLAHSPGHHDSIIDIIGWDLIYAECMRPDDWHH